MSTKKLQIIGSLGGDSAKLDNTLTKEGFAADSKAVGDALTQLSEEIDNAGSIDIDLDVSNEGEANPVNADTLGGISASDYATESYVNDKIAEAQFGGGSGVVLSDYAKKSDIPDISAFQTAEQVSTLINEALGVIENGSY